MADPQTAVTNQIRNIEAKTGKSFKELCRLIAQSGLTKIGEQRSMLIDQLGLGCGDANTLALKAKEAAMPAPAGADPLEAIYSGAKAPLRALHEQLVAQIDKLAPTRRRPRNRPSACDARSSSPCWDPPPKTRSNWASTPRGSAPRHACGPCPPVACANTPCACQARARLTPS